MSKEQGQDRSSYSRRSSRFESVFQREETHKKAFTKWINFQLAQANPPVTVQNLDRDLCDGQALLSLLEVLLHAKVTGRSTGKSRVHRLSNVQRALQICHENKIQLGGVNAQDIVNGTRKVILGLVWNIILHFQMKAPTNSGATDYSIERVLQAWCKDRLDRYKGHVVVKDFSKSWRDGLAFNAILHSYRRGLFNFNKLLEQDNYTRLENAFTTAHLVWSVPKLLDPIDVDTDNPDKKMITMYLSCLYEIITSNPTGNIPPGYITDTSSEESIIAHASLEGLNTNAHDHEKTPLGSSTAEGSSGDMRATGDNTAHVASVETLNTRPDEPSTHGIKTSPLISRVDTKTKTARLVRDSSFSEPEPEMEDMKITTAATHISSPLTKTLEIKRESRENLHTKHEVTKRTVKTVKSIDASNATALQTNPKTKKRVFFLKKRKRGSREKLRSAEKFGSTEKMRQKSASRESVDLPTFRIEEMKTVQLGTVVTKSRSTTSSTSSRSSITDVSDLPVTRPSVESVESTSEDWDISEGRLDHSKMYSFSTISDLESSPEPVRKGKPTKHADVESGNEIEADDDSAIADMEATTTRESDSSPMKSDPQLVFGRSDSRSSSSSSSGRESPNKSYREILLVDLKRRGYSGSLHALNIDYTDYLDQRLRDMEASASDLELCVPMAQSSSVDLASAKRTLDETKAIVYTRDKMELEAFGVIKFGRGMVVDNYFDETTAEGFTNRINDLEERLKGLREQGDRELTRLYDLYVILLRQNLERMHDWLVRAESKMTLDDGIGPTLEDVATQLRKHLDFQKELGAYSSVNMIFEIDMEDLLIDKDLREEVKAVSERWAAVWNWAEERKQRLNEVLFDWEQLRENELILLEWLGGREETLELIANTDITNEQEVEEHMDILEHTIKLLRDENKRTEPLREVCERLITDAQYADTVAQPIRDEVQDFDDCWKSALENGEKRKQQLMESRRNFTDLSSLVMNMKQWLSEVDKLLRDATDVSKNEKRRQEFLSQVELKCEEREVKEKQLNHIRELERDLDDEVDESSHEAMHAVTDNLAKRFQETWEGLDRFREGLPQGDHEDCCIIRYLKKGLLMVNG